MWYKIDFVKLVAILLPPMLRSKFFLALLKILVLPLRYLNEVFSKFRSETDDRLNVSANVSVLENALNRLFYLSDGQIYIVSPEEKNRSTYLHIKTEISTPFHLFKSDEKKDIYFIYEHEASAPINFIVMVPTFLCTSTVSKEEDKYGWKHLDAIRNLLNIYKPAGRTFSIILYDYE